MITHNDFYSGSFGKLRNAGGSSAFTIPHTVKIEPDYSININYNIQGDLIAYSLDGRLWLYRRSRRLGIIALKWNNSTEQLEFAAAQNISNNDDVVLACGLDWVLTNNNIFMVSDDAPYILSSTLFDANIPDTFLYSILRDKETGSSGLDPFTGKAWGMRDDNGNSEGTGSFSKNTHLLYPAGTHSFEQCYSLLPPVGDWQIMENFLVRRPNSESSDSYNYMHSLRPLIPLEFSPRGTFFGTGYNFDHRGIQLAHIRGQLWGRSLFHFGRVYILPAVFDEHNQPVEFYLYISPNYPYSPFITEPFDAANDWLNMNLTYLSTQNLFNNRFLYGFSSEKGDAIHCNSCLTATEPKIFSLRNNEWLTLADSDGKLFIDIDNSQSLILHENGAGFVQNDPSDIKEYECNTLPQWLAPAGKIEAITSDFVIASDDNSAFYTSINTGFNRQFITPCSLPLSRKTFSDNKENFYRLALSEHVGANNMKVFDIHSIASKKEDFSLLTWDNIYRNPLTCYLFSPVNLGADEVYSFSNFPIWCSSLTYSVVRVNTWGNDREQITLDYSYIPHIRQWEDQYGAVFSADIPISTHATLFFIHPLYGNLISFSIDIQSQNQLDAEHMDTMGLWGSTVYYFLHLAVQDNKIGFRGLKSYWHTDGGKAIEENIFTPIIDIPEEIKDWTLCNQFFSLKNSTQSNTQNTHYLRFIEHYTNTPFFITIPETWEALCSSNSSFKFSSTFSNGEAFFWVAFLEPDYTILPARVDIDTSIFDFRQELERSKSS